MSTIEITMPKTQSEAVDMLRRAADLEQQRSGDLFRTAASYTASAGEAAASAAKMRVLADKIEAGLASVALGT